VTRTVEENQKRGGVAIKFEAGYFRSLRFDDPTPEAAAAVYTRYRAGGVPSAAEYKTFQDVVFRYLVAEGGRLHLPVQLHSAIGAGDYFDVQGGNVMNLENVLRDPRYLNTTFVLIHGGYPFERQAIWLAAMKNVFLDSSETELLVYPTEFKQILRGWLETFPDKITFGSDAFPFNEAVGAEETYWLGATSSRMALAAALAEMVATGEITESRAVEYAHGYLHDNAARLYTRR
jgi:predicted TIM-barrel fold metal-dependent hydrolase